jgi:hypothetical protein
MTRALLSVPLYAASPSVGERGPARPDARPARRPFARALAAGLACTPAVASASFLSGDALDTVADAVAWIVLIVVPVIAIAVFWLVHVLPEKIAHRRHHPQKDAIQTLCLLSLVFGGLLWPLAWLWAYTRPTGYRLAYGTEKSDEWFAEQGRRAQAGELDAEALASLREELDAVASRGALPPGMRAVRAALDGDGRASPPPAKTPPAAGGE